MYLLRPSGKLWWSLKNINKGSRNAIKYFERLFEIASLRKWLRICLMAGLRYKMPAECNMFRNTFGCTSFDVFPNKHVSNRTNANKWYVADQKRTVGLSLLILYFSNPGFRYKAVLCMLWKSVCFKCNNTNIDIVYIFFSVSCKANWRAPCNNVLSRLNMFRYSIWQITEYWLIHVIYLCYSEESVWSYLYHHLATCQLLYKWPIKKKSMSIFSTCQF